LSNLSLFARASLLLDVIDISHERSRGIKMVTSSKKGWTQKLISVCRNVAKDKKRLKNLRDLDLGILDAFCEHCQARAPRT